MNLARPLAGLPDFKLFHTRGLAALVTWIAGLIALAMVAYWISRLVSPRPVAMLPVKHEAPRSGTAEQDMARLFGIQPGGVDASLDGIALTGVFANQEGGGFATFRATKGSVGVTVGQEIVPGLRLDRVESGRVMITSGGKQRMLELPKPKPDQLGTATAPAEERN